MSRCVFICTSLWCDLLECGDRKKYLNMYVMKCIIHVKEIQEKVNMNAILKIPGAKIDI